MKLNELTIKEALEGLKKKEFSSVDLTNACLSQIEKCNPVLNAFITVTKNEALQQAKKADALLSNVTIEQLNNYPLLGIPIALKDLFSTKGIKTTAGSRVLENYIPPYDATVVKKLKDAGAVIIGKTNLDAWGHGSSGENSDFGSTKNPWNKAYVPGGSSSGSAVAVSADMCLAATGTDTGGSIRTPASFCNVVGLKPTYGRVSRYGIIAMASSLDSVGHITKTVEDSALLLNVTAGNDSLDATSSIKVAPDYAKKIKEGIKGIKIGLPKEYDVRMKVNATDIKIFQDLDAELIDISLPHTEHAIETYYIIQPAEVSSNLARYDGIRFGNDRSTFGEEAKRRITLGTFTLSAGYYDAYYKKAMQVRTLIQQDFIKAYKEVDVILAPVSPSPAWQFGEKINDPIEMYLSDIYTVTANLAGIPGLVFPVGIDVQNNLPQGLQILGPHFSEDLLFRIGHAYEQKNPVYKTKPNL